MNILFQKLFSKKSTTRVFYPLNNDFIFQIKQRFEQGKINNPENPLNVHSIGVFYTQRGSSLKEPFSKHFFNSEGREIAYYNVIMKSGMVFSKPREWSLFNLSTLEITTELYKHDLDIIETFRPVKLGL